MVAGDTKRIIVIKNISSNLIEEAILILKNEPVTKESNQLQNPTKHKAVRNDFILKEAESIINQYIRENGLPVSRNKRRQGGGKAAHTSISVNSMINIVLAAALLFLIIVASKSL